MEKQAFRCRQFHEVLEVFLAIRKPGFLTTKEVSILTGLCDPCSGCEVKPHEVSPMTGRLYEEAWWNQKKRKECKAYQAQVVDIHGER